MRRTPNDDANNNNNNNTNTNNNDSSDDNDNDDIRQTALALTTTRLGVGVLEPVTARQERFAVALQALATFCLEQEPEQCLALIQRHLATTAGVLQGGSSETYEIYRLIVHDDDDDNGNDNNNNNNTTIAAGNDLMRLFVTSPAGKRYATVLTVAKLKAYMLSMCDLFTSNHHNNGPCRRYYTQLGNLMLILSFGPVPGQVRHIDDMDPNAQICLYMSPNCPSTVIYETTTTTHHDGDDGSSSIEDDDNDNDPSLSKMPRQILNQQDLVQFWQAKTQEQVPAYLRQLLETYANVPLKSKKCTRYFGNTWPSINATLSSFGLLYLPIQRHWAFKATTPGTTLIASKNQVHAGPCTQGPRMFAFAVAIPQQQEQEQQSNNNQEQTDASHQHRRCQYKEDNNGEVQYNPVLFHLDLCCILFSLMDFESSVKDPNGDSHHAAMLQQGKTFLLQRLVELIHDHDGKFYGQTQPDTYDRLVGEDRQELRDWLGTLVQACMQGETVVQNMVQQAALRPQAIFHSPDMAHCKPKRRGRKGKKNARERV